MTLIGIVSVRENLHIRYAQNTSVINTALFSTQGCCVLGQLAGAKSSIKLPLIVPVGGSVHGG